MEMVQNAICWFEIPVLDFERAKRFYLDRIVGAGGRLIQAKTAIEGMGHYAFFADSEGNKLGLFSPE